HGIVRDPVDPDPHRPSVFRERDERASIDEPALEKATHRAQPPERNLFGERDLSAGREWLGEVGDERDAEHSLLTRYFDEPAQRGAVLHPMKARAVAAWCRVRSEQVAPLFDAQLQTCPAARGNDPVARRDRRFRYRLARIERCLEARQHDPVASGERGWCRESAFGDRTRQGRTVPDSGRRIERDVPQRLPRTETAAPPELAGVAQARLGAPRLEPGFGRAARRAKAMKDAVG